jgi:hypothetical protein
MVSTALDRMPGEARRHGWLIATVTLTVGAFAMAVTLAPAANAQPTRALEWLLFVGSSVHVAATGWFYTVPVVRNHMRTHRGRYVAAPAALIVATAVAALLIPPGWFTWLLLGFFGWQFHHFQKQNLGMAALAGIAYGAGSVRPAERRALTAAGLAGTAGLLVHPELLQITVDPRLRFLFPVAGVAFAAAVITGLVLVRHRRSPAFLAVYACSLLFFTPVFVFASPYAAVAGLTIAHGCQYLLIIGLVADTRSVTATPLPAGARRAVSLLVLLNLSLLGGLALNAASHLHSGGRFERALYGAYLGAVMAHFVIDAGLWRLRDEFPRSFLRESLPYLLVRPSAATATAGRAGVGAE